MTEWKRARALRNYEFIRKADGRHIAKGETQWVFVDLTTGRPLSIPSEMTAFFLVGEDQTGSVS